MTRQVNYNKVAPEYDRRYKKTDYSGVLQALLGFVGEAKIVQVLEVGCGTGHWLAELAGRGYPVTGLEPAHAMLEKAKNTLTQVGLAQGYAETLPFHGGAFDRLFYVNAFHHFSNQKGAIAEARRVLKKGGGVMVVGLDPHTGVDSWWIYDYFPVVNVLDKKRYPSARGLHQMMCECGFTDCRTVEVQHMPARFSARTALEKGSLAKNTTSQLEMLTDEEYDRGMMQLKQDLAEADSQNKVLMLSADVRFYATTGWVA
jgi:ubiquinone/menaquinone biosynthesis C-methylase UbiE